MYISYTHMGTHGDMHVIDASNIPFATQAILNED